MATKKPRNVWADRFLEVLGATLGYFILVLVILALLAVLLTILLYAYLAAKDVTHSSVFISWSLQRLIAR